MIHLATLQIYGVAQVAQEGVDVDRDRVRFLLHSVVECVLDITLLCSGSSPLCLPILHLKQIQRNGVGSGMGITCKISNIEKASPMGRLLSAQSDQTLTTNYIGEYINILANICRKGGVLSPSRYTRPFLHL